MRKSFLTLICLIGFHSFSQEMIKNTSLSINKKSDVFQIVEENKKQVSLFFSDKNKVHSVRFDESFSVIDSIASESPSKDYDDIVGYSISGNQYYVYWSNSNAKEMLSQCFDYDAKKANTEAIQKRIAAAGHDTEKVKAPDSIYSKLPECCLFRENPNTHHD